MPKNKTSAARTAVYGFLPPVFCLLLAACASAAAPTSTPAPSPIVSPGLNPTDFLNTRVPQVLTENAALPTQTPTSAPQISVTPDPPTSTPLPTETPTRTPSPYPTLRLSNFPTPPATEGGEPHFYLARPVGEGGNPFIASTYRYGSTYNHRFETHHGVEFANNAGAPLVAAAPGLVYYAGNDSAEKYGPELNFYGNLVVVQLAQPWETHTVYALYGHMDQVLVTAGQVVNTGDWLGTVGATGVALGAHLHFEVRLDNPASYWDTRNPELWLAPLNGGGAAAVRVTNENRQYLPGLRVGLLCSDGAYRFLDTYWDPGVNPDPVFGENAAMTDLPTGICNFETEIDGQKVKASATIEAGRVASVWLRP
jgi:murein DD-endopeptidase MepM/ murein hydrolase activator NlpD